MTVKRSAYEPVDDFAAAVSVEQMLAYYGVQADLKRVGGEIRSRCFLNCGKTVETGDRALAICVDQPAKPWKCHQYGCPLGGNLVSLCDLVKPGASMRGRPRGGRFKEIVADLKAMVQGVLVSAVPASSPPVAVSPPPPAAPRRNLPLARSDNERARGLTSLDLKFTVDPSSMPPAAARYFRSRPFLTPAACRKWRSGYLPRYAGGDRSGGTMRGSIVYPLLSEHGDVLTWFGRNPQFEEAHVAWTAGGREGREPEKFHFVKGFHRGLELFGQQATRLQEPGYREHIRSLGILVVEGPNDVIALDCLGVPAVGLLSNLLTLEQAEKLARWARQLSNNRITLLLDCDPEGERGTGEALTMLAERCNVRLGWTSTSHGGQFKGRQPESLSAADFATIAAGLCAGA